MLIIASMFILLISCSNKHNQSKGDLETIKVLQVNKGSDKIEKPNEKKLELTDESQIEITDEKSKLPINKRMERNPDSIIESYPESVQESVRDALYQSIDYIAKSRIFISQNGDVEAKQAAKIHSAAGNRELAYSLLAEASTNINVSEEFNIMIECKMFNNINETDVLFWLYSYYSEYPIHTGYDNIMSDTNSKKADTSISTEEDNSNLTKNDAISYIDNEILIVQDGNYYGYVNNKNNMSTVIVFIKAWPFIDGKGCVLLENGNLVLLDEEFNSVWSAYDIQDTAPEIGEYENQSADEFTAELTSIMNSINGIEEDDVTEYLETFDYVQNEYGTKLYKYNKEMTLEFQDLLAQAMNNGHKLYEEKINRYNNYYDSQIKVQDYFQDKIDRWTPKY